MSNSNLRFQAIMAVLIGVSPVTEIRAATITEDAIISAENSFPGELVEVFDGAAPPTVVQMIDGGQAAQINVNDRSVFNFFGGEIASGLHARDTSQVNVRQGSLRSLSVRDGATANFYGGVIESDIRFLPDLRAVSTLNMFDGQIRNNIIAQGRNGIVNIQGGTLNMIFTFGGASLFNITGGSLSRFHVDGANTMQWSGGEFRGKGGTLFDDAVLNVYGHDLTLHDSLGTKYLSGTLLDGTNIDGYDVTTIDNSQIILHNVPEPSSLALLTVASITAFSLRRKRTLVH